MSKRTRVLPAERDVEPAAPPHLPHLPHLAGGAVSDPWTPRLGKDAIVDLLEADFPLAAEAARRIEGQGEGWLTMRLPFDGDQLRPGNTVSGPTQMTLADTAMYFLVLSHIGPVPLAVTSSLHIDFLARPGPADLCARAELLRLGRSLAVGRVVMTSGDDPRPVSHATVTYAIPRGEVR